MAVNINSFSGPAVDVSSAINRDRMAAAETTAMATVPEGGTTAANPLGGSTRLYQLLTKLQKLLSERYAFDVFAKDSINFGVMVTYRQKWVPETYQVGDLVSTIPLAPKEMRRYTTRKVTKKTRATKELEDQLTTRRTESSDTGRVEIGDRRKGSGEDELQCCCQGIVWRRRRLAGRVDADLRRRAEQAVGAGEARFSRERAEERTGVPAAAPDRDRHERERGARRKTTFHEIQNPNDELTVTYLFYELQRTYRISEKIRRLTPVILVANDVPAPNEIDDAWLLAHDWILRRTILDDSFRPALDYLSQQLRRGGGQHPPPRGERARPQERRARREAGARGSGGDSRARDEQDVLEAVRDLGQSQQQQGIVDIVKRIFDPIGITGTADTGVVSAAEGMLDYAKEARDRADRERARLLSQLEIAMNALQGAVDKLSAAVRDHYDKVAEVDRLRVHVKENILYYMQAIWSHEPPDQRFFRLYNIDVPVLTARSPAATVRRCARFDRNRRPPGPGDGGGKLQPAGRGGGAGRSSSRSPTWTPFSAMSGNYTIFRLKENNLLTLHMMQDYLDVGDQLWVRDPDELADYTVEELRAAGVVSLQEPQGPLQPAPERAQEAARREAEVGANRTTTSWSSRRPPSSSRRSSERTRCSKTSSSYIGPST